MMKNILSLSVGLALALVTSQATAQSNDWMQPMYGSWKSDVDKTLEVMKEAGSSEDEIEMMKSILPGISMKISEGKLVLSIDVGGQKDETNATFEISDSNRDKKWVEISVKMEQMPEPKTGEITILGKDSIKLETDEGEVVVFQREKKEKEEDQ